MSESKKDTSASKFLRNENLLCSISHSICFHRMYLIHENSPWYYIRAAKSEWNEKVLERHCDHGSRREGQKNSNSHAS